jgi:hypothetical protein
MLLSGRQNVRQNHDIKLANRCFDIVAQLKYLGTTVTGVVLVVQPVASRYTDYAILAHYSNVQNYSFITVTILLLVRSSITARDGEL